MIGYENGIREYYDKDMLDDSIMSQWTHQATDKVVNVTGTNAIRLVCSNLKSNVNSGTAFMQGSTALTPLSIASATLY